MNRLILFLCNCFVLTIENEGGIEIKKKDKYIKYESDPDRGTKEIYTSMLDLEGFFMEEVDFVEDLRALYEKKLVSLDAKANLGTYIDSFESVVGDQEEEKSFVHNPVNAYSLLRHVAVGWAVVEETLEQEINRKSGNVGKRVFKVRNRRETHHVPEQPDVDGVARGIVRLHDYYKFNTSILVNEGAIEMDGIFHETTGEFSVWDAFKIGVKGTNALILGSGIQILEEALIKANIEGISSPSFIEPLDMKVLRNLVRTAKTIHDQKLDRWGDRSDTHSTLAFPFNKNLAKKKKFQKNLEKRESGIKMNKADIETGQETYQYMELCKGRDLRPAHVIGQLTCIYSTGFHLSYLIGPLRVEIVSLEPYITVVYNFASESETEEIIKTASPLMRRSEMVGKKGDGTADDRRVSEQAWLMEEASAALNRLTQRIDMFLNLNALSSRDAELYQVANYGLGGHYQQHYDQVLMGGRNGLQHREIFNIYAGDRLATVMTYLSDVAAGGNTVFPFVGAAVKPVRGAAVIWWNMDTAGGYDDRVKHGACPVMIGSKWITNKWVRANSQMFRRQCPKYTNRQVRGFREGRNFQRGGFITDPS